MGPRWRYLFQEVVIGLRRNLLMTIATVVTVTVSLALAGAALLAVRQVNLARDVMYAEVEVSIFLNDDISAEQRDSIEQDLRDNALVQEVIYESKQAAYQNALRLFRNDPNLLQALKPDDLPASFRVKLHDPEQFEAVASEFRAVPGIQEVVDQRDVLEDFFRIMRLVTWAAAGIAALQFVAAVALIANTIRISAFARREQTGIMKLVGATNWYIRLPFVVEGIAAGVVGAIVAWGLLMAGNLLLLSRLKEQITIFPFITSVDVLRVLPWMVVVGAVLSAIAAFFSLRRFLDV